MDEKKQLRQFYKKKRTALDNNTKLSLEGDLFQKLRQSFLLSNKKIHVFLPIQRLKEIDTTPLLQDNSISWVLSVSNFTTHEMTLLEYDQHIGLKKNDWDIPEPMGGKMVDPKELDILLVPLLCFDLKGYRVGYGKGFYDRFIAKLRPHCIKVGLSLFDPVRSIAINEFDQKLDAVVTPKITYYF